MDKLPQERTVTNCSSMKGIAKTFNKYTDNQKKTETRPK